MHERLAVYPAEVVGVAGRGDAAGLPATIQPMAGTYTAESDSVVFRPRFPFVPGAAYTMVVQGAAPSIVSDAAGRPPLVLTLSYPARSPTPVTDVVEIWPIVADLPRNQLRLYIEFSQPMSEGFAEANVTVVDVANGKALEDALLPMEPELWSSDRRRLSVLFDPGRIKRGLQPHAEAGYPLEQGMVIDLIVAEGFLDGQGRRLRNAGTRRYRVGPDLRGRVDPGRWVLRPPRSHTHDPLRVDFGRVLDHALLTHCLTVIDGRGNDVIARGQSSDGGTAWSFVPHHAWASGPHELLVDATLEDVAGNSVRRVFDRDLSRREDDPVPGNQARVRFLTRG